MSFKTHSKLNQIRTQQMKKQQQQQSPLVYYTVKNTNNQFSGQEEKKNEKEENEIYQISTNHESHFDFTLTFLML